MTSMNPKSQNRPAVISFFLAMFALMLAAIGPILAIPVAGFAIEFGRRGLILARQQNNARQNLAVAGLVIGGVSILLALVLFLSPAIQPTEIFRPN